MFGHVSLITLAIFGIAIPMVLALTVKGISWMKDNYVPSDDNNKRVGLSDVLNGDNYDYDEDFPTILLHDLCVDPAYSYLECNASHDTYEEMNNWLSDDMNNETD